MIWSSEWYQSKKDRRARYRFFCDKPPIGRLNLEIDWAGLASDDGPVIREATKRYPLVLHEYGEAMGVTIVPHPDPFGIAQYD